ncbi:MAG: protein kinase [Anaerolineae bacterium]
MSRCWEQTGGALIAAHRKGIIHGDIKPDNILLDAEGNAYLADFGIAKNLNATNNSSGNFRGTPAYVAPEQIKGEMLGSAHRYLPARLGTVRTAGR